MLFGEQDIPNMPSADTPDCHDVPPTTTVDGTRDDDATVESNADTDEKHLAVPQKEFYVDQVDLGGSMLYMLSSHHFSTHIWCLPVETRMLRYQV